MGEVANQRHAAAASATASAEASTDVGACGPGPQRPFLAADIGSPCAARAVGTACATNPLPLVLPCHRVIRSDGTAGAYIGGHEVKLALLNLEHATRTGRDTPASSRGPAERPDLHGQRYDRNPS